MGGYKWKQCWMDYNNYDALFHAKVEKYDLDINLKYS